MVLMEAAVFARCVTVARCPYQPRAVTRAPARSSALRLGSEIAQLGLFAPILRGGGMTGWASL